MARDIDKLADDRTRNIQSPGEDFYDDVLLPRPKTEWASCLDETAKDISADIGISDINLGKNNFGHEVGSYYRRGLEKAAGEYTDLPDLLNEYVNDEQLGFLSYQLNELSYEITREDASLENIQQAVEAVVEKLLTRELGANTSLSALPGEGGSVATIATQLFKNEMIASNIDTLLNEIQQNAGRGLLSLMDEPQMMTPLWEHQCDALVAWSENDYRGYVDMATATGKTVLALGALALRYGELHPTDQGLIHSDTRRNLVGKDEVLIVAHNELILEQWRREFDRHLNIPKERTTGSDDITLTWGRIHFRTPQSLVNEEQLSYDLVLLDEAHHYATGSEWRTLLDEFDCDVLAMSGSVDDAGSNSQMIQDRLTNSIGPQLKRYTISEARDDDIIPSFDWEIRYAPFGGSCEDLGTVAKRCERAFKSVTERLRNDDLNADTDRRLRTYQDFRVFAHTSQGNTLKQQDKEFRDFVTRLYSRQTKHWNLSPSLDAIVDLVTEHVTTEKVVVLADSNSQVEALETRLTDRLDGADSIYVVSSTQDRTEQRETIDTFDEPGDSAVLIGTGDLLGEGVDMQNASVAINMATGSVNPELVQRIGRVLRNPDTPKHAMFYNVVGIPQTNDATVPREDGKQLLEDAAAFCDLGSRFDKLPGFATADSVDVDSFEQLLIRGTDFISTLDDNSVYEWTVNDIESTHLRVLHRTVSDQRDSETILGAWEEYAWEHSEDYEEQIDDTVTKNIRYGSVSTGTTNGTENTLSTGEERQRVQQPDDPSEQTSSGNTTGNSLQTRSDKESVEKSSDTVAKKQSFFWNHDIDALPENVNNTENGLNESESSHSSKDDLDRKIDDWKSQCLDLTRRNKLINFKATKTKSLPLTGQSPTAAAATLVDEECLFIRKQPDTSEESDTEDINLDGNEVLSTRTPDETADSLYRVGLHHKQYLRERGVDTLYLSLGMLRWYSVDHSDSVVRSPLFLTPVELEEETVQNADRHNYVLKPKPEGIHFNPALRKKLQSEHGLSLPVDDELTLLDIDAAFKAVHETVCGFDRWLIQDDVVLGIFDFAKFGIYTDLEKNREEIKNNPIVRALNDDHEPLHRAEGSITSPSAEELDDDVDPADMYQVLDADSSQQEAIEAAKHGRSFVLQGPPGTGKSQTISNIIAEKLADGEKVLFVSEKQAALNVVKERLDDAGIGRFCLEAHGKKANNSDVLASLEEELNASQSNATDERKHQLQRLQDRCETINEYGSNLFYSPPGWDLTVYQAFGILGMNDDAPHVDIGISEPLKLSEETVTRVIDELETLARFEDEIANYENHPWKHTTLTEWAVDTSESMRRSLTQQQNVIEEMESFAEQLESELDIEVTTLADFEESIEVLTHLTDRPDITWQEAFFDDFFVKGRDRLEELAELEQERTELIDSLSQDYERSFFSINGTEINNELAGYGFLKVLKPSYRSLRRRVLNHAHFEYDPDYEQLLEDTRKLTEVQRLEELRENYQNVINSLGPLYQGDDTRWGRLIRAQSWATELNEYDNRFTQPAKGVLLDHKSADVGLLLSRAEELQQGYEEKSVYFKESMAVAEMTINDHSYEETLLSDLREKFAELHNSVPDLQRWVQFSTQLEDVRDTICDSYVDEFLGGEYPASELVPAFTKRYYTKWLNTVYKRTELGSFNAEKMGRYLQEFRQLDEKQQRLAEIEIQHEVTKRRPTLNLEHASGSEEVIVRREIEKQSRHKPLRELFDEAGGFITQLTPCLMMSPLSVAQYLKADTIDFSTVIFDEASQIMPEDAISSVIRADQAVIAGDTKQLPPTSFFQSDIEAAEDVRQDLDSVLEEAASVLPEKHLRWHYRSRTNELIEFSNHQYYNGELRTFPENNSDIETGVDFKYVSDGVYDRGGSRQNEIEAQRVIDVVEDHAENASHKSLGVVAFSSAQEQAIRDALEERQTENQILEGFVNQDDVLDEFFIKNLEMVQGDERDRMIFSIGYGPDKSGNISMNFGPLNKDGGERRLNVAVTRAKEKVTVISSLQPGDIDLTNTSNIGVENFKKYLQYAKNGEQVLARDDTVSQTLDFDSQFEEAVYTELESYGFDVVTQVQSSSYSIDLAIKHPDRPGEFVLGIECDGAAYHSSKTARDRDRIRQSVLEDLGWTIHRIWSPDWISNKECEIQAIREKVASVTDETETDTGQ
jgi:superfamily II DNA or RNA helicase/very-short-patch-repair endonuclease